MSFIMNILPLSKWIFSSWIQIQEKVFNVSYPFFQLPFPGATIVLFVVFVVVMAIIMMNLFVGLAVDDIKEVQEHAELKKLSSQVEPIVALVLIYALNFRQYVHNCMYAILM